MKLSDLKPNPANPRKITDKKLAALKKALVEFGDLGGFVFNRRTGQLVGGHQRAKVFETGEVVSSPIKAPTSTGTVAEGYVAFNGERFSYREVDWDESREKAANIAANKGAGEWDLGKLGDWFKDLDTVGFDLDLTMFDEKERAGLLKREPSSGLIDDDEIPECGEPRCKLGDLWQLGEHRLFCGDSTDVLCVERLMGETKNFPVLMATDPPYGISLDHSWRDKAIGDGPAVYTLFPGNVAYVWHDACQTDVVKKDLQDSGFDVRQMIIWNKTIMVMGRSAYHWKHEPCWYAVRKGKDANWQGDRKQTTVWDAASPNHISSGSKEDKTEHPSQKPTLLSEIPIFNHTKRGDGVYDPFLGSGSTLIACEKTKRKCYGMELDPHYCDVIIERWEKFTGNKAILQNREAAGV